MHRGLTIRIAAPAVAVAVALLVPGMSSGHATVSALQPQGPALTAARTTYVVRAPNEKAAQSTFKVVLFVPAPVQTAIFVRQSPDWKVRLARVATGQRDAEGNPVYAVQRVSWTAKTADAEIAPGMFGEWGIRFQNPAVPTTLCFPILQYYRGRAGRRRNPEVVRWLGDPATSETPRSCLNVVPAPPAP